MSDDAYRTIVGLRAVRGYTGEPISDEDLEAILQAGRWTGSAKNLQKWAFVVIRSGEMREAVAGCGNFTTPVRNAPLVIALIGTPGAYEFDIGRLAQNMMLAAAARGVGSCPVTLHDTECAHRVLGVPDDHHIRYAIAFGYPDDQETARQRRRLGGMVPSGRVGLDELVHEERFD